jgi:arylsulfatase A-like enzyme/Tfp pilus assembly protein PilF
MRSCQNGIRSLGACLAVTLALACEPPQPPPQRVVLISIDTLRADHVGAYGAENAHTPTLDALADAGVRFETAISPAPLTLPSHTTLLTGLDPPEHGVRHNGIYRLGEDVETLATRLQQQGFATAAFVGAIVLGSRYGLSRGFDDYDDSVVLERSAKGLRGFAERPANAVIDAALAWLASAPERFFLFVHLYDPHAEDQPPPGFAAAFPGNPYAGEIAFADQQVGRLIEALDALDALDPGTGTLIIVTADHGDSLGEHGEATHSHFVYDSTQHVPLLMRGAGLPAGKVVPGVVALRDVAPTVLDLLRLGPLPGTEDRSALPRIRDQRSEPRVAYLETLSTQFDWEMSPLLGLRGEDWKYVRAPTTELYDLREDPGETRNLAGERPQRVRELDAMLEDRLKGARSPIPNVKPEEEERARLEALGYVATAWQADRWQTQLPGRVGGRDPKDGLVVVRAVNDADKLHVEGRSQEALELLLTLKDEQSVVYHTMLSTVALEVGDARLAEESARRAVSSAPLLLAGHMRLGNALLMQGRTTEARAVFEGMLSLDPEAPAALTSLGLIAEGQGRVEEATEWYERAVEAASIEAPWRLTALYLENDRLAEADALIARAAPESFVSATATLRLALAEAAVGRRDSARERLARGVRAHPDEGELRLAYARLLGEAQEAELARLQLEAALKLSEQAAISTNDAGELARASFLGARALAWLGRREEARAALELLLASPDALSVQEQEAARVLAQELGMRTPVSENPGS